jgi:hypothetical protein
MVDHVPGEGYDAPHIQRDLLPPEPLVMGDQAGVKPHSADVADPVPREEHGLGICGDCARQIAEDEEGLALRGE